MCSSDLDWVSSVAFSPDGKQVVSGSHDETIRLWDAATGAALQTLKGYSGLVISVAFSSDGKQVVSGSGMPLQEQRCRRSKAIQVRPRQSPSTLTASCRLYLRYIVGW